MTKKSGRTKKRPTGMDTARSTKRSKSTRTRKRTSSLELKDYLLEPHPELGC